MSFPHYEYMELAHREQYGGETFVASQFIPFGTVLASDDMLFMWKKSQNEQKYMSNICSSFLVCEEHVRAEIVQFYAPSELIESIEKSLVATYSDAEQRQLLAKVVAICRINSYELSNQTVALYRVGAKVSHSCAPNVAYHMNDKQQMVVIAQTEIQEGEAICASYIPDAIRFQSAKNRDAYIAPRRYYHCGCDRCVGPDLSRVVKCLKCQEKAIRDSKGGLWKCDNCISKNESGLFKDEEMMLDREEKLEKLALSNLEMLEKQDVDLDGFVEGALKVLDEQHWVIGLTRQMQFEKSLFIAFYANQPNAVEFDKLDLYLSYLNNSGIGVTIYMDQMVSWCIQMSKMNLSIQGISAMRDFARHIHKYWTIYFGKNDQHVVRLGSIASICAECNKESNDLKRCARCKSIVYCSPACQRSNWPQHKLSCK